MPATAVPQDSVISRITSLLEDIDGTEKRATELGLSGEGKQDPGGYQGKSTHPSATTASNVQKTPLGSRAKENETDVKKEHPGGGVDNTSPKSGGSQDDKQYNIGTTQSATGEDPSVEDHYRDGGKDDKRQGDRGGTEGPFNAEEIGEKYSSLSFPEITKLAYDKMNNVLVDVANGVHIKEAMDLANGTTEPIQKTAQNPPAQPDPKTAAAAGYQLADMAGREDEQQKQAAVQATVEQTIIDACSNANLVGEYLTKYATECERLMKQSNEGPMGGAMEGDSPMPPPGPDGAGAPPPGMPPPGGPGGGEGGPGGGGEGIDEIINALLDMGYTPEDVMAALQEHGGGGAGGPPGAGAPPPGGMPPEAGGPPAMEGSPGAKVASDREVLFKLASAASEHFRAGKWKMKPVQVGTKEATDRQELQKYIVEICNQR